MKKTIVSIAIIALLFAACRENKNDEHSHDSEGNHTNTESVHEHEDGSLHEDHQDAEHHQEEFMVNSDSTSVKTENDHGHTHDDVSHKH